MILLLAGASETGKIASALAQNGFSVTVSTATLFPLEIVSSDRISRRVGSLTDHEMIALCVELGVTAVVDATHPYAVQAQKNARTTASHLGIPYFRYNRPPVIDRYGDIHLVDSHEHAAQKAVSFHSPILLTSGTRNLKPYVDEARKEGVELYVRALDCQESRVALASHGIPVSNSEFGVGPFSVDDNTYLIRKFRIGVLVTKDGGLAGGLPEKLEAARLMNCEVVLITRPETESEASYDQIALLIGAVKARLLC